MQQQQQSQQLLGDPGPSKAQVQVLFKVPGQLPAAAG
jgi:hypothetical protein